MVVDAVGRRRVLVVNVDLVGLYRASHAHHAQVVLELEPALAAPDEVNVGRNQVRLEDLADRQFQMAAVVAGQQREIVLLLGAASPRFDAPMGPRVDTGLSAGPAGLGPLRRSGEEKRDQSQDRTDDDQPQQSLSTRPRHTGLDYCNYLQLYHSAVRQRQECDVARRFIVSFRICKYSSRHIKTETFKTVRYLDHALLS